MLPDPPEDKESSPSPTPTSARRPGTFCFNKQGRSLNKQDRFQGLQELLKESGNKD